MDIFLKPLFIPWPLGMMRKGSVDFMVGAVGLYQKVFVQGLWMLEEWKQPGQQSL